MNRRVEILQSIDSLKVACLVHKSNVLSNIISKSHGIGHHSANYYLQIYISADFTTFLSRIKFYIFGFINCTNETI